MRTLVVAAVLATALGCHAAMAQTAEDPPLLKDIPAKATLPADGVFDIRGIALGMTIAEVEAAYKAIAPQGQITPQVMNFGIRDNRGNSVNFKYTTTLSLSFSTPADKSRESIQTVFTTGHSGARAVHVSRTIWYDSPEAAAKLASVLEAIQGKYGPPSFHFKGDGINELSYIWHQGKRVSVPPNDPRHKLFGGGGTKGTPEGCLGMAGYGWTYRFEQNRNDTHPGCTAAIVANTSSAGWSRDLVYSLKIEMTDKARFLESARAVDQWLLGEMTRKQNSEGPRRGPPL